MRACVLIIAIVAAAGSATKQAPPPGEQPGPGATGTCEGACRHYLECKGMSGDDQAFAQCVPACGQSGVDSATLAGYEVMECASAVSLVEQEGQLGGGGAAPQGGTYMGGGGGGSQPVGPPPAAAGCPPIDRARADASWLSLLTGSGWCGARRLAFTPDGVVDENGQRGCWRLLGTQLAFSGDGVSWQETAMQVSYDRAGNPTVVLNGTDRFQRCR